jgi:cytochrome P450
MVDALPPRFNPLDLSSIDDPYPTYADLRRAGPLLRGGPSQWVVPRYAEVAALLRDPRVGSEFPEPVHRLKLGAGPACDFFQRIVIDRDPPAHARLRQLLAQAFRPSHIAPLAQRVGELVDELLAAAHDGDPVDVARDLAYPLPVTVVCELLGVPRGDRDEVHPRVVELAKAASAIVLAEKERPLVDEAVVWLRDYIGSLLEERRRSPKADQLTRMFEAETGPDPLPREEIVDNAVFLFFAGFETTMNMITNGCVALARDPGAFAALRADPSLVPGAVEEFLRYDSPVQVSMRLVREPVEVCGRKLRPGRIVMLLLGSANHDERVFADPERLDVRRQPNPHVAFGGGHHFCLGAVLARLEGAVVFERLVRRFATLEAAAPPVRRPYSATRSFASAPMALRAA